VDGIRARNVTGVQTCALPIWKQCRAYGSDRRRWLPYPEPLVGWRAPLTGAYPITPQTRLGVRVGNQRFQIPRAYLDAIGAHLRAALTLPTGCRCPHPR